MEISYEKLWILVRENRMKKGDLMRAAKLSKYTLGKLNHNEPVGLEVMQNICKVFHCNIGDVMDMIEEEHNAEEIKDVD